MTVLGGMTHTQLLLCLAGGGTFAGMATLYHRGYYAKYFDDSATQESESVLAPINKSASGKVKKLPSGPAAPEPTHPGLDLPNRTASSSASPPGPPNASAAAFDAKPVVDAASSLTATLADAANAALDWVRENPAMTVALAGLLYALYHSCRKIRAHETYEDRLRREAAAAATASSSSTAPSSPTASSAAATAAALAASGSSAPSAAAAAPEDASTWAIRARPRSTDPAYDQLINSLTPADLDEFAEYVGIAPASRYPDLVQRVRDEVLSIAPSLRWSAARVVWANGAVVSRDPAADGARVLRFFDPQQRCQRIHPDGEFALDMIDREFARRQKSTVSTELV